MRGDLGIARSVAQSHQEPNMARNAVADRAEPRQVNKETFLEQRWQRIVQVGRFGKSPKLFCDLRSFRG